MAAHAKNVQLKSGKRREGQREGRGWQLLSESHSLRGREMWLGALKM